MFLFNEGHFGSRLEIRGFTMLLGVVTDLCAFCALCLHVSFWALQIHSDAGEECGQRGGANHCDCMEVVDDGTLSSRTGRSISPERLGASRPSVSKKPFNAIELLQRFSNAMT